MYQVAWQPSALCPSPPAPDHRCTSPSLSPPALHPTPQAAEGKLGRAYEYHRAPAPFVQLELLRLLAALGAGDKSASENMYAVIAEVKRRAEPLGNNIGEAGGGAGMVVVAVGCKLVWRKGWGNSRCCWVVQYTHLPPWCMHSNNTDAMLTGIWRQPTVCAPLWPLWPLWPLPSGNALVYECVKAVAAIHPSPVLIAGAMESVSRFLSSRCGAPAAAKVAGRSMAWHGGLEDKADLIEVGLRLRRCTVPTDLASLAACSFVQGEQPAVCGH